MARFTYAERMKLLMAAMDFCPDCQRDMTAFAGGRGMDLFTLIREVIWKWYGAWPHGAGCPQVLQPEAAPRAAQVSAEPLRHGPGTDNSVALGAAPGGGIPSNQESREPSMVLRDPEAGSLV